MTVSRRSFLAAAAAVPFARTGVFAAGSPNDRVRLGVVGVGQGQGQGNLKRFLKEAEVVAVCDVDKAHLAAAVAAVTKAGHKEPLAVGDYRKLLDRKDIDAVVLTTPDHWHALPTVHACQAGKDVYCEKPLSLTVEEGKAMLAAARKYDRVVQTGSQQRSDDRFRRACELVRNGKLGRLTAVRVGIPGVNFKGNPRPDGEPPAELDYEFWLGPAPYRPYNAGRVHYNFRFFWDYSGGQLTNFGAHHLDIVQWALGMDRSGPVSAEATAEYDAKGVFEVPARQEVTYAYGDGVKVVCGQKHPGGVTFVGERGTLFVDRSKITADPPELLKEVPTDSDVRLPVSRNHAANWLECVRSRKRPVCDVEVGHRSATVCHLGNIAIRAKRKVAWDPAKEEVVGDAEAAAMTRREYRKPWELPKV